MDGASLSSAGKQYANNGSVNPLKAGSKKHGTKRAKEPNPLSVKKKKKRCTKMTRGQAPKFLEEESAEKETPQMIGRITRRGKNM